MAERTLTLLASGIVNLVSAAAFTFVAVRLATRPLARAPRRAMLGFAAFWTSVGFYNLVAGALDFV